MKSRSRIALASIITSAFLVLTGCTASTPDAVDDTADSLSGDLTTQVTEAVGNALALSRSTQAVVGVWSAEGDLVQTFATEGEAAPENANALFRGAQVTQPMLCALLLDMVETGEVSLDRMVAEDLPRQTGIGEVTYRQLCDGTSGLPDFKSKYTSLYLTNPTRNWPTGEKIAEALIREDLSWPGLDVHRSDSNAVLLGRALDVIATDESLSQLLSKRVFLPTGMNSTTVPSHDDFTIEADNRLTPLAYLPGPQCESGPVDFSEQSPSILGAAGSTITNVGDVKRFYEAYLGGSFGGAKAEVITSVKPVKNPERAENGEPTEELDTTGTQRGFGILRVGNLWGFDGALPGSITSAWHNPDSGFTVVVALNNSTAGAGFATDLAKQIAAIMGESGEAWTAEDMAASLAERQVCPDVEAEAEGE